MIVTRLLFIDACYGEALLLDWGHSEGDQLARFAWGCSGFSTKCLVSWETALTH